MNGELRFECDVGVRNRPYLHNNITFETYWVDALTLEVVSNGSELVLNNVWERTRKVEVCLGGGGERNQD